MANIAKLRIESKGLYEIEVNDNGDTIVFDTLDFELPFKLNEAFKNVNRIIESVKGQIVVIDKKKTSADGFLTNKDYEYKKVTKKAFSDMRMAMDAFLGENGCQKIFGDRNYFEMFDDLFKALSPHFEAMGISQESIENKIADKYSDASNEVLE
ncbi:MAG: hypothetical protein NC397_08940 [Clostridium sp.]|nr:hypothetical protein [Clostridium sp.]